MEFVDGGDLQSILETSPRVALTNVSFFFFFLSFLSLFFLFFFFLFLFIFSSPLFPSFYFIFLKSKKNHRQKHSWEFPLNLVLNFFLLLAIFLKRSFIFIFYFYLFFIYFLLFYFLFFIFYFLFFIFYFLILF